MTVLDVRNLRAGYENGFVLEDVSFSLEAGDFTAVLGKNGSGKSTLIKAVQGLLKTCEGNVTILGREALRLSRRELAGLVAYVPQFHEPAFDYTVEEVVTMGRYARRGRLERLSSSDRDAVEDAMTLARVRHLRSKPAARLSGGEARRVDIARALAQDAQVLLLDEPSAHLDICFQVEIYRMLRKLQVERKTTILAAEHNVNLAVLFSRRLMLLKNGRLEALGTPVDLITRETIRDIFEAEVDVRANPRSGLPEISLIAGDGEAETP